MTSALIPRPKAGDRVKRIVHLKVTVDNKLCMRLGPITGRVLAVVDDRHAVGDWVALVRWWDPSRQRHRWEAHDELDFSEERGDATRVDVMRKGAKRR